MQVSQQKLVGIIRPGGGINYRHWIDRAKRNGFMVLLLDNRCLMFRKYRPNEVRPTS